MLKESLKELLDNECNVEFPYKQKLDEWFSTIRISKAFGTVYLITGYDLVIRKESFDEIYDEFLKLYYNIGLCQSLVQEAHPELEPEDPDDWEKLKALIEEKFNQMLSSK